MYPTPAGTKQRAEQKPDMPLILCEYTHAMGNSNGGLKEYWDVFYNTPNAQGAFVWDWVDQGIRQPVPEAYRTAAAAKTFFAYGGWWEDRVGQKNDNNFSQNGLVSADRVPHPGLGAIKYVYRYPHVQLLDRGNNQGADSRQELVRLRQSERHGGGAMGTGQRGKSQRPAVARAGHAGTRVCRTTRSLPKPAIVVGRLADVPFEPALEHPVGAGRPRGRLGPDAVSAARGGYACDRGRESPCRCRTRGTSSGSAVRTSR